MIIPLVTFDDLHEINSMSIYVCPTDSLSFHIFCKGKFRVDLFPIEINVETFIWTISKTNSVEIGQICI